MRFRAGGVDLGMTLLPQALKERGYSTHMLGKWHLGLGTSDMVPTKRGFDTWLGFFAGAEDHWNHRRRNYGGVLSICGSTTVGAAGPLHNSRGRISTATSSSRRASRN